MRKMPTLFERDWNGDRSRVTEKVNPLAQWVIDGEGVPTQKHDGTACLGRFKPRCASARHPMPSKAIDKAMELAYSIAKLCCSGCAAGWQRTKEGIYGTEVGSIMWKHVFTTDEEDTPCYEPCSAPIEAMTGWQI